MNKYQIGDETQDFHIDADDFREEQDGSIIFFVNGAFEARIKKWNYLLMLQRDTNGSDNKED